MPVRRSMPAGAAARTRATAAKPPLPDGQVYGPRPDVKREVVDVELAKRIITEKLGEAEAKAALSTPEMTMQGIEAARRLYFTLHPEKKVRGAVGKMDEELEAALHAAGALRKRDAPVITIFKPKEK